MKIKVLFGILLSIFGLGAGVLEWVRSGLATPFPMLGLAATAIGLYLIADGLRKRRPKTVRKEDIMIGTLLTAVIGGAILATELKKRLEGGNVSREEIDKALMQLELLRAQGRVPPGKYAELKEILENAKLRA